MFGSKARREYAYLPRASSNKILVAKKLALRRGIWYKTLNRIERGVLDLTAKYVANIRSAKLAKVVMAILEKLKTATESTVDRLVRTIGLALAQNISSIAVKLGNVSAKNWRNDGSFACFLAVMATNQKNQTNAGV